MASAAVFFFFLSNWCWYLLVFCKDTFLCYRFQENVTENKLVWQCPYPTKLAFHVYCYCWEKPNYLHICIFLLKWDQSGQAWTSCGCLAAGRRKCLWDLSGNLSNSFQDFRANMVWHPLHFVSLLEPLCSSQLTGPFIPRKQTQLRWVVKSV